MTLKAFFDDTDGRSTPFPSDPTPEQAAFMLLSLRIGVPRLDASTMDEFVRRAELYQAHVGYCLHEKDGPVLVGREILDEMLGGHTAAWTNASGISRRSFDALIRKEQEAATRTRR